MYEFLVCLCYLFIQKTATLENQWEGWSCTVANTEDTSGSVLLNFNRIFGSKPRDMYFIVGIGKKNPFCKYKPVVWKWQRTFTQGWIFVFNYYPNRKRVVRMSTGRPTSLRGQRGESRTLGILPITRTRVVHANPRYLNEYDIRRTRPYMEKGRLKNSSTFLSVENNATGERRGNVSCRRNVSSVGTSSTPAPPEASGIRSGQIPKT